MAGIKLILELDTGVKDVPTLVGLINDRFRDLGEDLKILVANPATSDVDLGGFQIHQLADPSNDLDAVNLRTLKRVQPGDTTVITPAAIKPYTVVFSKSDIVDDDEILASFTVGEDREGSPVSAWFRSKVGPVTDANFNMTITLPGKDPKQLFKTDAVIVAGSTDDVFKTDLTIHARMPKGTHVDLWVGSAGGADLFSAGLIVQP